MIPQVSGRAFGPQQTYTRPGLQPQSPMAVPYSLPNVANLEANGYVRRAYQVMGFADSTLSSDDGHVRRPRSITQSPLQNPMSEMPQQQQAPSAGGSFPPMPTNRSGAPLSPYAEEQYGKARQEAASSAAFWAQAQQRRTDPDFVSPSAYNPNRQPPTGKNANPDGSPLTKSQMGQWDASRGEAARDADFWAAAEKRRAAFNAANPPAPGSAVAQTLARLEQNVQREMQSRGIPPQSNPIGPSPSGQAAADFRRNEMSASPPQSRLVGGVDHGQHSGWTPRPFSLTDPSTWVQWPSEKGPTQQISEWADSTNRGIQSAVYGDSPPASPPGGSASGPQYNPQAQPGGSASGPQYNPQAQPRGSASSPQYDPQAQAAYEGPTGNPIRQAAMPGSSNQAGLRAGNIPWDGRTPSQGIRNAVAEANGYNGFVADANDPNRMTPDQKYAAAQQSAQRMGQSDPTNMSGRFGADSALGQQAAKNAQNEASVAAGTQYEIPQGYGTLPEYRPISPSPEVRYRANPDGSQGSSYLPNTDPVLGRQQAAARRQWGDLGSPAGVAKAESRRTRKAAETTRREGVKFRHMISQGMNPMSPQAQGMFPKQVAEMKGQQAGAKNPLNSPFSPAAPNTPANQEARRVSRLSNLQSSSYLQGMGASTNEKVTADTDPGTFARLFYQASSAPLPDQGLQEVFNHIKTFDPTEEGHSPFAESIMNPAIGVDMLAELWRMPENSSMADLRTWHGRYLQTQADRLKAPPK